jgi:hypothetical protein
MHIQVLCVYLKTPAMNTFLETEINNIHQNPCMAFTISFRQSGSDLRFQSNY